MSKPSSGSGLRSLGVPDGGGELYELALTHRSYAFEQPVPADHNERLEFLGDAILGAIVTDLIFRSYPDLAEGEMAKLRASVVKTESLADVARAVGLGDHLKLGRGEESSGGRAKASLLADTLEAVVGAVYLDRGIDVLARHLVPIFAERVADAVAAGGGHDPKTTLQERVVRAVGDRPSYRIASSGPDHDKTFTAHVYVEGELLGVGTGRSKKEAEQHAADQALARLPAAELEGGADARAS